MGQSDKLVCIARNDVVEMNPIYVTTKHAGENERRTDAAPCGRVKV